MAGWQKKREEHRTQLIKTAMSWFGTIKSLFFFVLCSVVLTCKYRRVYESQAGKSPTIRQSTHLDFQKQMPSRPYFLHTLPVLCYHHRPSGSPSSSKPAAPLVSRPSLQPMGAGAELAATNMLAPEATQAVRVHKSYANTLSFSFIMSLYCLACFVTSQ